MSKGPVISIVDDDPSVRAALLDLLGSLGLTAEAFPSAAEFLKSGALRSASCLIVDMRMPAMGGLELRKRLVASGNPIPTIMTTTDRDDGARMQALKAGASGGVVSWL